jgi:hypothetical protein
LLGMFCCSCQLVCLFIAHVGGGSSPLSCGVFLPPPLHNLSCSWLLGPHLCSPWSLCCQAQLVYLQFWEEFPYPLLGTQCAPPSLQHVFIVLIVYYSVSLFSPGEGQSVHGAMLFWPGVVCGSTAYHLAHLVCIFPSHLDAGDWQSRGPPGFSI